MKNGDRWLIVQERMNEWAARTRRYQAGSRQMLALALVARRSLPRASYAWAMQHHAVAGCHASICRARSHAGARAARHARQQVLARARRDRQAARANPNFRLAHLVKGDLLLARARPINPSATLRADPPNSVDELRDEARVRLVRYADRAAAPTRARAICCSCRKSRSYALVVDTTKSTLFVFENTGKTPRYVTDYYISLGKNGIEKQREGDKKTPLGVYHVVSQLPQGQADRFLRQRRLPDQLSERVGPAHGRNGHGIWLHGTPSRHLQPPAARQRRLRRAHQRRPRALAASACRSARRRW